MPDTAARFGRGVSAVGGGLLLAAVLLTLDVGQHGASRADRARTRAEVQALEARAAAAGRDRAALRAELTRLRGRVEALEHGR